MINFERAKQVASNIGSAIRAGFQRQASNVYGRGWGPRDKYMDVVGQQNPRSVPFSPDSSAVLPESPDSYANNSNPGYTPAPEPPMAPDAKLYPKADYRLSDITGGYDVAPTGGGVYNEATGLATRELKTPQEKINNYYRAAKEQLRKHRIATGNIDFGTSPDDIAKLAWELAVSNGDDMNRLIQERNKQKQMQEYGEDTPVAGNPWEGMTPGLRRQG